MADPQTVNFLRKVEDRIDTLQSSVGNDADDANFFGGDAESITDALLRVRAILDKASAEVEAVRKLVEAE